MEATVTYKKKIIDLKEDTFKALSVMAARQGTNLTIALNRYHA